MHLTTTQLKAALAALDATRRAGEFCLAPRLDTHGQDHREHVRVKNGIATRSIVSYGTHGSAFLQLDPQTLQVRCGACAGELDATADDRQNSNEA